MRFEKSKELYSYWLGLKGGRLAPERSEIQPNDIRSLLGDTFILEVNHAAKYVVYRLAGTRLCAAYGRELKGLGYLVNWREEDNIDILKAISGVYSSYTPSVISHHAQTEQKRFMEYETLLLPLQPLDDGTTRILGISSPKKIAFWHGSEPVVSNHVRSIRRIGGHIENNNDEALILAPPEMHMEESHKTEDMLDTERKKYSHLTVIDGGKS